MNNKIIIVSGPVIVKDSKVLLNQSGDDNFWKFCGGKVNESENLEETAKRRVAEEMGLEIEITKPTPFLMHTKKPGEPRIDVILVHFLAKRLNEIQPGEMVKEWDWFDVKNLPKDLAPNILPILKYFNFLK